MAIKLIIYNKSNGTIQSIWSDYENNSIDSIFSNNIDMYNQYGEIVLDVPLEVEQNRQNYRIDGLEIKHIEPDIESVRQETIKAMDRMCEYKIINEFYSDCLGEFKHFGCKKDEDQPWIGLRYFKAQTIKQMNPELADTPLETLAWKNQDAPDCFPFSPNQMITLGDDMELHLANTKNRFYALRIWANDSSRTVEELQSWTWDMDLNP